MPEITRVEIIDYTEETPRTVIVTPDDGKKAIYELQDDDRTLKVFIDHV